MENIKALGLEDYFRQLTESVKTEDLSIYVIVNRIKQDKWKMQLGVSTNIFYELRQIFNSRFAG